MKTIWILGVRNEIFLPFKRQDRRGLGQNKILLYYL